MQLSLKTINKFLSSPLEIEEISKLLEKCGVEIDGWRKFGDLDTNIVIAKIIDVQLIPGSKKLKQATVFDGNNSYQVVCGAPNCRKDMLTVFAKIHSRLYQSNGSCITIEPKIIHNTQSFGMLCSPKELEIGENANDIAEIDLPNEHFIGEPIAKFIKDYILEVSLTPDLHRCVSCYGIAQSLQMVHPEKILYHLPEDEQSNILFLHSFAFSPQIYNDAKNLAKITSSEVPSSTFFAKAYCSSIEIPFSPEQITASIFGVALKYENNCIMQCYSEDELDDVCKSSLMKKVIQFPQNNFAISRGMDLYASLIDCEIFEKHLSNTKMLEVFIDIERFASIYDNISNKQQIINILDSSFKMRNENTVIIPEYLTEYKDPEHILSLLCRYIGVNRFTATPFKKLYNVAETSVKQKNLSLVTDFLVKSGCKQLITNSIVSQQTLFAFDITPGDAVEIQEKNMCMRKALIQSVSEALKANHIAINDDGKDILLYEVGKVFEKHGYLNLEKQSVLVVYIPASKNKENAYKTSGIIHGMLSSLGESVKILPKCAQIMHPFISGEVFVGNSPCGFSGQLHETNAKLVNIKKPVFITEIVLSSSILNKRIERNIKSTFEPSNHFDITVPAKKGECFEDIKTRILKSIECLNLEHPSKISCVDIYEDKDSSEKYTARLHIDHKSKFDSNSVNILADAML